MAYLLLILTSLFWSGNFVLSKGINQVIPPISLGFWRWLIAGIILLPFSIKFLLSDIKLIKRSILHINLLAIFGVSTFNTLIYTAVHYTTAINAILINSFVPIIILLLSFIIYRDKPSIRQILGIITSMVGIFSIMLRGEIIKIFELSFNKGDILVIIAAFVWAVYTVLLKTFSKGLHPLSFLQSIIILGIMYMLPFYINEYLTFGGFTLNIKTVGSILYVSIFASVIAFIFWNRAVKEVGANKAGPFVHLMPVFGTIMAVLFLGETLYIYQIIGILLVFSGILMSTKK